MIGCIDYFGFKFGLLDSQGGLTGNGNSFSALLHIFIEKIASFILFRLDGFKQRLEVASPESLEKILTIYEREYNA